ncbi:MAG: phenylalanine--tRNA ligase subunit beta [Acidobacteriaceae bacterium]|nr:phenylalanine--tRNA ligase subunit beta [Acidobacteriaceae bacterium]
MPGLRAEPAELQRLITMKTAECEGIHAAGGDWIIEIDNKSLTHRPDLWGHYGMAREVAAFAGGVLKDPVRLDLLPNGQPVVKVEIQDYSLCPRYSALVFEDVKVNQSPLWLQDRLRNLGLNPINNIVDVTNYILAELPQPMHAFDADKLAGKTIFVRSARGGERLKALNGEMYMLSESDLVIADSSGSVALAGVIGGLDTAISETSTRIVLESANFNAASIRLTSSRHKLRTDASMRFEKSLDPENTTRGLARAMELLREVCPGIRAVGGVTDNRAALPSVKPIVLPIEFVIRKLGEDVSEERVSAILGALGFGTTETAPGVLTVSVPSWRATKDISIKDDLVEEIGRMVGYEEITPAAPLIRCVPPPSDPMRVYVRQVRSQLAAQGFTEVYNYSFVNESDAERFEAKIADHVAVTNPIASELTHLRRSLLPGIFRNIITNVRNYDEFRIFEIGGEIHPTPDGTLPGEITHLAAAIYNARRDAQEFFELKRVIECVFAPSRLVPAESRNYEHPARAAEIQWQSTAIGRIFEIHPSLLKEQGIEGRAVFFDVDLQLSQKLSAQCVKKYSPARKYPTSDFDLSVVATLKMPVDQIRENLARLAGSDLATIDFVRQYDGPPLAPGQKSVSYRLKIGALDHTLTAEEASRIRNRVIDGMRDLGFELRV